jgi:hypothetical protein
MVFNIWCDECYTWVDNVYVSGKHINCYACGNVLLIDKPEKEQKKIRIEIAKGIWGL